MNKVVARFRDGRMVKGFTHDFTPARDRFHVDEVGAAPGTKAVEILRDDLKALFFVKDFAGDPRRVDVNDFDASRPAVGRRIRVVFQDGEVMVGTTLGYQPGRPGFFLEPADAESNIRRCFVVARATREVRFIPTTPA